jgi:hypothetical protein
MLSGRKLMLVCASELVYARGRRTDRPLLKFYFSNSKEYQYHSKMSLKLNVQNTIMLMATKLRQVYL